MRTSAPVRAQRGVITLLVSLIMLVLITVMVLTTYTMSTTNFKAVGNMQMRDEAIAAANMALEERIGANFTIPPLIAVNVDVDIDHDGTDDYRVAIAAPVCLRASRASGGAFSSVTLPAGMSSVTRWHTMWDFDALVTDLASGASVRVHSGVRALVSDSRKNAICA
jgi:hypothetical protein